MSDQPETMTDDEMEEMMYLYRVIRAENGTKEEVKRCQELLDRFAAMKKQEVSQ